MITEQEKLITNFQKILEVTSSQDFLKMDGLGGEVPFWIAPYDIQYQDLANQELDHLIKKLYSQGISVLKLDLLELSVEIIDKNIGFEKILMVEKKKTKEKFKKALQSTLNLHERFIPLIAQKVEEAKPKILMLTGVGGVFPFIRSHNVLNNLQSVITEIPTLLFFPGEYNGIALNLFGNVKDDNYYRAFNIFEHNMNVKTK